jgi:hypothetical protein
LMMAGGGTGVEVAAPPGVFVGEAVGVGVNVAVTNSTTVTGAGADGLSFLDGQPWSQRAEAGNSRAHKRAVKRVFIGRSLKSSSSFFKIKNP